MMIDPSGHAPEWLKLFLDYFVTVVATVAAITVTALLSFSGLGILAFVAGLAVYGGINNGVNAIYYNYISDGKSNLNSSSYTHGYVSRWDRLDYTKEMTKEDKYNFNAWRFYSEYDSHMYAWMLTSWAYEKNIQPFSSIAIRAEDAEVDPHKMEDGNNAWRNIIYIIFGLLGL